MDRGLRNLGEQIKSAKENLAFLEFLSKTINNLDYVYVDVSISGSDLALYHITKYNDNNEPCGMKHLCNFPFSSFESAIDCVRATKIAADAFEGLFLESYQ